MKQILIDFIDFHSAYRASIHFKHRESLTVTCNKGGVAQVVAELLRPIQGRIEALEAKPSLYAQQRHLDELTPTDILDTCLDQEDCTVYREIL